MFTFVACRKGAILHNPSTETYQNNRGENARTPTRISTPFLCQIIISFMLSSTKLLMSSAPMAARGIATAAKPFNRLVLIRHGESQWNKENRFTGWYDVPLSDKGVEEARNGGKLIKAEGLQFDAAYTSCLKRAIKTLFLTLEESDQLFIPVTKSWRLNERHYGALTGLNKQETVDKHGIDQVRSDEMICSHCYFL